MNCLQKFDFIAKRMFPLRIFLCSQEAFPVVHRARSLGFPEILGNAQRCIYKNKKSYHYYILFILKAYDMM